MWGRDERGGCFAAGAGTREGRGGGGGGLRSVRFNLSHCSGLVCLAVALSREVGVDSEVLERRARMMQAPPITTNLQSPLGESAGAYL